LLSCYVVSLNAYDSLVENEPYFKKAIEKSKLNGFGKDRVIAVLDTGINDNAELRGKVIAEYDFTTNSEKAIDSDGHGTKMASVIASANDGKGITGVAYNAKLIDVKVVDANGNIKTQNIIKGIEFAVKHGATVVNMSFSSGEYSKELESTIDKYVKQNVIFVAAAGNDGEKAVAYPSGYKNVIAVSSLDRKTDKRAIYANYGKHINEYVKRV
jgi:serine protease